MQGICAVVLCLAIIIDGTATTAKKHNGYIPQQQSPWGVVSYGGDAPSSNSLYTDVLEDENNTVESSIAEESAPLDSYNIGENNTVESKAEERRSPTAVLLATSSQISGGGFANAPISTTTKHPNLSNTTPSLRRTSVHSSTKSSLSVATNQRQNTAEVTTTEETADVSDKIEQLQQQSKRPLKILFLSSDTGGGHRASAEALANQFQRLYPGTTYDLLDIWDDSPYWPYYTIKNTYKSFSATPWKWRTLYYVSNNALYAKFADYHSYYMNEDLIREKMEAYDPDVVVSVHPTMNYVPLFSVRKISEKIKRDIPFFTVVTDFGSGHCTWFNKDVDKIYLASEPIKQIAQSRGGVPDEKIMMSGLPIRYDFAKEANAMGDRTTPEGKAYQMKMKEKLNINTNKRMILVMGGGEGVGSLSDIVNELYAKLRTQGVDATICVVCGRNEQLKSDLETRCWDTVVSQSLQSYESLKSRFYTKILSIHAHRSRRIQLALDRAADKSARGKDIVDIPGDVDVIPLGFTTNMAEYMVAADILVTKAGPGTIAEAAAVGLPIMVTSHLPGQEAGNVDIVLNGGFGDFCEDPETIGLEVACWLQDSQLIDDMSTNAMKVGHPHAAEEIAQDIGDTTHQWMERNELKRK